MRCCIKILSREVLCETSILWIKDVVLKELIWDWAVFEAAQRKRAMYCGACVTKISQVSIDLKGKIYQRASLVLTCDQRVVTLATYSKQEHSQHSWQKPFLIAHCVCVVSQFLFVGLVDLKVFSSIDIWSLF